MLERTPIRIVPTRRVPRAAAQHQQTGNDVCAVEARHDVEGAAVGRRPRVQSLVHQVEPLVSLTADENRAQDNRQAHSRQEQRAVAGLEPNHAGVADDTAED